MIDIRKLKELVRLMVVNELSELDLRDSEEQVTLRRGATASPGPHFAGGAPHAPVAAIPPVAGAPSGAAAHSAAHSSAHGAAAGPEAGAEDDGLHRIVSPMVGTFYSAPNPDSEAFVSVGSSVGPDTVVCIVEAMKIFNEIRAECSGTIEQVLVKNGDSIEFGQPLFAVKPV